MLSIANGKIRFNSNAMLKLSIDEKKTIRFLHDKIEKNIYLQISQATIDDKTVIGNLFYSKKATDYLTEKFGAKTSFEIKEEMESTVGTVYYLEKI